MGHLKCKQRDKEVLYKYIVNMHFYHIYPIAFVSLYCCRKLLKNVTVKWLHYKLSDRNFVIGLSSAIHQAIKKKKLHYLPSLKDKF